MGNAEIRKDLEKLVDISETPLIDPTSMDDQSFKALVHQYERIAHTLFNSRTASLLKIVNKEFTDEKFKAMFTKLSNGDKMLLLLTLQRSRLKEYESISYVVKNIANIADIMRKAQMSPDDEEIMAATPIDLKIIRYLIKHKRWLGYEKKLEIYEGIRDIVRTAKLAYKALKKKELIKKRKANRERE